MPGIDGGEVKEERTGWRQERKQQNGGAQGNGQQQPKSSPGERKLPEQARQQERRRHGQHIQCHVKKQRFTAQNDMIQPTCGQRRSTAAA